MMDRLRMMDKLFHFDSPQEVYTADACVISCFDARFDVATCESFSSGAASRSSIT